MAGTENIRCKVCDYSENPKTDSVFHNSTTDGYARRTWRVEPDGPVCSHCENPPEDTLEDGEIELLVEDDWPEDWGKQPLPKKGFY